MSMTFTHSFGRRSAASTLLGEALPRSPAMRLLGAPDGSAPSASVPSAGVPSEAIAELRSVCLARLEPAAVAAMPPERLASDVERLISEIATERRIQLNGREQRALAGELANDILGLGQLETLLEDHTLTDIVV